MEKEFVEPVAQSAPLKKKWVEALRGGEFKQWRGTITDNYGNPTAFCCVGVAAKITGLPVDDSPYAAVQNGYGIGQRVLSQLFSMNDKEGMSFAEIADWIETHDLGTGELLLQAERSDAAPTPLSE